MSRPPRRLPDRSFLSFSTVCVLVDCERQVISYDFAYSADKSRHGWLSKGWPFEGLRRRTADRSFDALARGAARCIVRLFLLVTSCTSRRYLHRSILSLARPRRSSDRSFLNLARRAARRIAHCFPFQPLACLSVAKGKSSPAISLTPLTNHDRVGLQKAGLLKGFAAAAPAGSLISIAHPPRRSLHRLFLSLADVLRAAPLLA
jgi:hypothetical protein